MKTTKEKMKIAIVRSNKGFAPRWEAYCKENNIEYITVNPYDSNIIQQVDGCDAFMWHFAHYDYRDMLFARQLIFSLEQRGIKCFPNSKTCWHFDDKVGQKYLLESIGAPLVPSYVFYTEKDALKWMEQTSFPKVFKLRGGAGSTNVLLAHSSKQAKHFVRKAFNRGYSQYNAYGMMRDNIKKFCQGKSSIKKIAKSAVRVLIPPQYGKMRAKEIGYAYFQDFIPNNTFDIRVVVIGDKAFALKRLCRKGDFRASGGGSLVYDKGQIDERCVQIAFEVNEKLQSQSIAFDFVFDEKARPMIVEISYGYTAPAYDYCEGYWTIDMQWHDGSHFDFCGWMVENLVNEK